MSPEEAITLVEYNAWANHRVLTKAAHLTPEQLTAKTYLSFNSILGTLIHILDTQWYWREGIQSGNLPGNSLSVSEINTLASLRKRWKEEDKRLIETIRGMPPDKLNGLICYKWPQARPRQRYLWQILYHIINHSTHHRGEIGQYLNTLAQSPGNLDFIIFVSKASHKS